MIEPGTYSLGPDRATLSVHTGRKGAAAKAGHDLRMHVTAWEASLAVGEDPAETTMELTADSTSLRVQEGTGGMQTLGDEEIANIHQTIDDEVLERGDIAFRSTEVGGDGSALHVRGDLTLAGKTGPVDFDLALGDDGSISATTVVTQSDWGMKPYSALFGALKVADEVRVELDGHV